GVTARNVMEGHGEMQLIDILAAGYNFLPAILFFTSLATLAFGWAAKLGKITYAYLGYTLAFNDIGVTFDLPDWLAKTYILNWLPQMPKENFDIFSFVILSMISIVFIILGYIGYKKRDLIE